MRVMVAEDEPVIAMLLRDMLEELGHEVVAHAAELDAALGLAATAELDLALLDVNLGGRPALPVVELLRSRAIPALLVTGYDPADLPDGCRHLPVLRKPYDERQLAEALDRATTTGPQAGNRPGG